MVIYCYPMTGRPDIEMPEGRGDISGARGCTPQSCCFRDHHDDLKKFGMAVYGLSAQYQKEMAERLHLPFPILSDEGFKLSNAMSLPMFEVAGLRLLKRVTMVARDGVIEAVHFLGDSDADWVIDHLSNY